MPTAPTPQHIFPSKGVIIAEEKWNLTLGGLFQAQASANGAATAVESDGHALSYAELHKKALDLAGQIHALSPCDESPVGILIPRGINHILAQIAVLYSGRSCVPLDIKLFDDLLGGMLHNINSTLVICDQENMHRLPAFTHVLADHRTEAPNSSFKPLLKGPRSCSHILHTSGTTGKPKAVETFAEGLINLCHDPSAFVRKGDRVGHIASVAFDISLVEIWGSLLNGATVVSIPMETVLDPIELSHCIKNMKLNVVQLTTSLLDITAYALPSAFSSLDTLITGGEAINVQSIRSIFEGGAPRRIINGYGPTECSVYSLWHHVLQDEAQKGEIPVGKAFGHVETFLVDENLMPVKPNVIGELLVAGAGVAGGYIGEPEKTAKSFVSLPHLPLKSNRGPGHIYRTGDLMRMNEDGVYYYVGRRDSQVKIRGQRVEIEALESSLLRTKLVSVAVVIKITPKEVGRSPFLVAFCVPISPCTTVATITKAYVERYPHLIVPRIELMGSLPLKTSGKMDRGELERRYLAKIEDSCMTSRTAGNDINNVEAELKSLCIDILSLPTKGFDPTDDFMAMGANSLMAATLLARINHTFGVSLRASMLYENMTLRSLTNLLEDIQDESMELTHEAEQEIWLQDSQLGQHLKPLAGRVVDWEDVSERRVFLTGATGFVGAFFLAELLQMPSVNKVACLIRAKDEVAGRLRLEKILRKYQIYSDLDKVVVVPGSFGEANLGLPQGEYDYYAEWASVVFHLGAKVSYVAPYSSHRMDNVVGTCSILKFANHKRPKATHYTSTIAAYGPTGLVTGTEFVHEDERPASHLTALHYDTGYAQSQYVAEAIVWNAIDNGLPVAIYRPGFVLGHSKTGVCNPDDFVSRMFTSCMELGCYPLLPAQRKEFIPVDYIVGAMLHISKSKDNLGHAYNLVHPDKTHAIDMCTSFNLLNSICPYPMHGVTYTEWVESLSLRTNDPLYPLIPMLNEKVLGERTRWEVYENMVEYGRENLHHALKGAPEILACEPMARLFERYLRSWLPISCPN
jgi:amino acid adenylation domain-containing protein/thioester reductase-like protein